MRSLLSAGVHRSMILPAKQAHSWVSSRGETRGLWHLKEPRRNTGRRTCLIFIGLWFWFLVLQLGWVSEVRKPLTLKANGDFGDDIGLGFKDPDSNPTLSLTFGPTLFLGLGFFICIMNKFVSYSCCLADKSRLTLCDPMDCSPPGSSVHENFQARSLEWVAIFSSRGSSSPREGTHISCLAGGFFTTEPSGKSLSTLRIFFKIIYLFIFIYLAAPGLSWGTKDFWFSLWQADS